MHFAKHETFHIRDGWIYKGLMAVREDPHIFMARNAPEVLGLGKNMVRALRFWMQAVGLTVEKQRNGYKYQELTSLGTLVFQHDPYLEIEGSVWLLHHQLLSRRELATTWYWFFNHYVPVRFSYSEFLERLQQWINLQDDAPKKRIAESSLRKDFDCFLRTYLPSQRGKLPEDVLESPFASLGLLTAFTEHDPETNRRMRIYRFESTRPQSIPPLVFLYILLAQQEAERPGASQVGLHIALREPRNVGRTFNIGMFALEEILASLEDTFPQWRVKLTRTGGLDQLTLPNVSSRQVLRRFYEAHTATEEVQPWRMPRN